MKTKMTFFNEHAPGVIVSKEALDSNVGKTLPLTNTITGETGEATILAVDVDEHGITVTYETEMNFGMRMDHFAVEVPQYEEVTNEHGNVIDYGPQFGEEDD